MPARSPLSRWFTPLPLLLLYFGAHTLSRALIAQAPELDESEQLIWSQTLAGGYGPQPPLYTWLQWLVFQILGVSVTSLALLKNALLAVTYTFVWLAARPFMAPPLAVLAAASMLLIPQIGWESQRDLTHSVAVTCAAAATLCAVVSLIRRPRPAAYVLLGVALAAGALSKYNFLVFAGAMAIALLCDRDTRPLVLSPWIVLSFAIAGILVLPHALWLLGHWNMAASHALGKLEVGRGSAWRGLYTLGVSIVSVISVVFVVFTLVFGPRAWRTSESTPICGLWRRYLLSAALLLLAMIVIGGATHIRERWLEPLLFAAPLMFFSCRPALSRHKRLPWLAGLLVLCAVLYLILITSRPMRDGWRGKPNELNQPAVQLAAALRGAGYDGRVAVITDDVTLGGMLRLQFPAAPVVVWKTGDAPPQLFAPHLLIAEGERTNGLFERSGVSNATRLSLPYLYAKASHPPLVYRFIVQP